MKSVTLALLALACATAQAGPLFRCTLDGKTSYQEQPCPSGATQVVNTSGAGQVAHKSEYEFQTNLELERAKQIDIRNNALAEHKVVPGLSAQDARGIWGEPTRINQTMIGNNTQEQWIYRTGQCRVGCDTYVTVRNGTVIAVQRMQGR